MMQYIHEVYYLKSKKPFATITTKKAFKQAMLIHYFNKKSPKTLAFYLKGSPSTHHFLVIPHINRLGKKSIVYARVTNESFSR